MDPGQAPEIQGASDAVKTEQSKNDSRATLEQGKEMDLEVPQPVDEVLSAKEVDKPESDKEKTELAKVTNKRKLSEKKSATLVKAREAKKQKKADLKAST